MPACSESYPRGPYRFINREYFIIPYESDPDIIREMLPEPLEPVEQPLVLYEWIRMPDSTGFGDYTESGVVLPCKYQGEEMNFVLQMYLDVLPPIVAGREIWGFPKEYAHPTLEVVKDTLTGTLKYSGEQIALGTMMFKPQEIDKEVIAKSITKTQVNLKLIPSVEGKLEIAQLVAYKLENITVKGAWEGEARLHLVPHVHAPVADLPIRKVHNARHFIADLTLPFGKVLFDYLKQQ
jgi:acetoacetate decarboxylase